MDNKFTGGILIASEEDMDAFLDSIPDEQYNIHLIPGCNIKTGCYGLFRIGLDQCTDDTDRATLEEAIDAIDEIQGCVVSSVLSVYYPHLDIDYTGIINLADAMIFLADETEGAHAEDFTSESIENINNQITEILGISQEEAIMAIFGSLGFKPKEIEYDDSGQLEFEF